MTMTEVYLRDSKKRKRVTITAKDKPSISSNTLKKWQDILDAAAKILNVPAGLIMRITESHLEVLLTSDTPGNPYKEGDKDTLGHGLYCETVIGEDRPLYVKNALESPVWKENPDVALNMISYYGLPLKWHDGEVFGTICVLSEQALTFTDEYTRLLKLFSKSIEADLYNLALIKKFEEMAHTDALTQGPNRRHILEILKQTVEQYHKDRVPFSLVMLDLEQFKAINDTYGHHVGDQVLTAFANSLKAHAPHHATLGRYGGDEFLLILPRHNMALAEAYLENAQHQLENNDTLKQYQVRFSYGIAEMKPTIQSPEALVKHADHALYDNRRRTDKKRTLKS